MKKKCYIYTRVSTAAQTEGYSLEAQQERLRQYAEYKNLEIAGEYCDAGKSGKSILGRPAFMEMMDDIASGKDQISYVLVFKLSRFGRNAADVLKSIQTLLDYDVDLVCVEDSIDSSTQGGRLTLAILSAVAEIERENIRVQFMAGRMQKMMEGGWAGGPVPFGYRNKNGKLTVEPGEAEIVRLIYAKYLEPEMKLATVVRWLNDHGYRRISRGSPCPYNRDFAARVLDNPFYCGKIVYYRRTNRGRDEQNQKKAAKALDVSPGSLHDLSVGNAVHRIIPDGAAQFHGLLGFLRFQPCVDIDRHIRFGEVFPVKSTARHRIGHITAQLTVCRTRIHIRAAGPVAQGIDLGAWIPFPQLGGRDIALAEDEPCSVNNVLPIRGISVIHTFCNLAEGFLLLRDRHPLEDTVVAAADSFCLVIGKVSVLRHFHIIQVQIPADTLHNGIHLIQRDVYGTLRNDVADAVADEDFHSDPGIFLFPIRRIHQSAGDTVRHLIRVARIYFLKHGFTPSLPGADAPSNHPGEKPPRNRCCSFLSRSGRFRSRAAPPGSCS